MRRKKPSWIEFITVRRRRRNLFGFPRVSNSLRRRLYVDVSVISQHDAGTGIQRVVRAVAKNLLSSSSPVWEIYAVASTKELGYRIINWPHEGGNVVPPKLIEARPGDVFLGLDFSLEDIVRNQKKLRILQSKGLHVWFVMYDLLPIQRPDWFSRKMVQRFRKWMRANCGLANGYFCISSIVADDLRRYLIKRYNLSEDVLPVFKVLPMGCDINQASKSIGISEEVEQLLDFMSKNPTILMVGTLEPRKGHEDVLAAFDHIWNLNQSIPVSLVIVGRPGWNTEELQIEISNHRKLGQNLFWLQDATDQEVDHLYQFCSAVIVGSHAEGFGLPLLEAIGHGKRVLARDIPIFRTYPEHGVMHFSENADCCEIARKINELLSSPSEMISSKKDRVTKWADASHFVLETLAENN